jgi:hypothetical protein
MAGLHFGDHAKGSRREMKSGTHSFLLFGCLSLAASIGASEGPKDLLRCEGREGEHKILLYRDRSLDFFSKEGKLLRHWQRERGYPQLSPRGKFALGLEYKKTKTGLLASMEVMDPAGNLVWNREIPGGGSLSLSDSGAVLELPGEYGGRYAIHDTRGKTHIQRSEMRPLVVNHQWSPEGRAVIVYHAFSPRIACLTDAGELRFQTILEDGKARVSDISVRDDCSAIAVLAKIDGSSTKLLSIDSNGVVKSSIDVPRPSPGSNRLIGTRDDKFVAYVGQGPAISVFEVESLESDYVYQLPKDSRVAQVVFGRSKDELFVALRKHANKSEPDIRKRLLNNSKLKIHYAKRGKESARVDVSVDVPGESVSAVWKFDSDKRTLIVPTAKGIVEVPSHEEN